ncbi:MAG: histidine--tRNA ligase [Candidatus Pacebacteria bacterium]|nr:histidine--tRNA ligase [Candidatus Paceibacterota bacterium]MBP9842624.1 histidine--tRNA ligase [Candidatus Paceibacterota bacterium]
MSNKHLPTDSYKGVRDFYPEDMAIQRYIFDTWAKTAEKFGFERYDASILEPADLYKAKGAENAELVNEQTYTFTDRGEREVTLRPEMTPTVARMVAAKHRELSFPLRWYSIPNLFRYENTQKGRLREHWQLNCDIFGATDYTADIEIIALAYQTLIDFGATPDMFEIQINDRKLMNRLYTALGVKEAMIPAITRLNDRREKIDPQAYRTELKEIVGGDGLMVEKIIMMLDNSDEQTDVVVGLAELGISNVVFNKSLARGFDYYTGTIFEIKDTSGENKRSLLGGGRYDNLTSLFTDEIVSGIGFGMGDVTMRDFLKTHSLLNTRYKLFKNYIDLVIIPAEKEYNLCSQKIAQEFRSNGINCYVDISSKKQNKKEQAAIKLSESINSFFSDKKVASFIVVDKTTSKTKKFIVGGKKLSISSLSKKISKNRKDSQKYLNFLNK